MRALVMVSLVGASCLAPGLELTGTAPVSTTSDAGVADAGPTIREALTSRAQAFVGSGTVQIEPLSGPETASQVPTLVVGIISPRFTGVITLARDGEPRAPTSSTLYPLSSITKLVTGLLAARDVVEGEYAADAGLGSLLSADLAPLAGDRSVLEAVTHTAGYQANPMNLAFTTMPLSPAAGYSRAQLATCLAAAGCSTARIPRGEYLYSNLGVGLLGLALQDRRGVDFETLVSTRLTSVLQMTDTHTRAASDESRLLMGVTPTGLAAPAATMGVLGPAGDLCSTADDLMKLLDVLVHPRGPLAPAIALATTPAANSGRIAWAIDVVNTRSMRLLAKSGEQAGFSSQLMWSPALGVGVFALTNRGASSKTLASLSLDLLGLVLVE
ncbi:MAG: serine hydrolase domain-containing protein [Myxococcales bacterium]|nr:serine hydrolase domain-containing protein [Myxococcales bacterium]